MWLLYACNYITLFVCTVLPESVCPNGNACSQDCLISFGEEVCSCVPGYSLADDGISCIGKYNVYIHPASVSKFACEY